MKKVISISMVIAILFAFTACASKEYVDIPVTDKDGQAVTDENGEAVTERVLKADTTASSKNGSSTSAAASDKNTSAGNTESTNNSNSASQGNNKTTAKADNKKTTTKKTTTAKQTTTKPTTTEKAKKRDVTVTVYIPVFSDRIQTEDELKTELTLYYRAKGKKDWEKFKPRDITLEYANEDKLQKTEEFTIKNAEGILEIKAEFKGVDGIKNNTGETTVNGKECVIKPVTSIENLVPTPGDGWI